MPTEKVEIQDQPAQEKPIAKVEMPSNFFEKKASTKQAAVQSVSVIKAPQIKKVDPLQEQIALFEEEMGDVLTKPNVQVIEPAQELEEDNSRLHHQQIEEQVLLEARLEDLKAKRVHIIARTKPIKPPKQRKIVHAFDDELSD